MACRYPALAGRFVEDNGSSGGYVERTDTAGHGDAQQVIAGAAHKIVEAGTFAAEDEHAIASEIKLVVIGCAAFVEADDPQILPLEFFKSADEVDDTGDTEVLGGSGACFNGYRTERGGTALGEDDSVDAGTIGYAEESAEILRDLLRRRGRGASGLAVGWNAREAVRRGLQWTEPPGGERGRLHLDGPRYRRVG